MIWIELKIVFVLILLLLIPGWAFLAVSGLWRRWKTLQRWFLAIGISIAFYPVLYYLMRTLLPMVRIGRSKLWVMLAGMFLLTIWGLRKSWLKQFKLGYLGGLVLAVLGVTLLTRFWMVLRYSYPVGTDSLHHLILTHLTASNGQLPLTLLPYAPTPTNVYHLGLYALTAPLEILADVPAHSALLWTAQALNGLCGISVFLFLDKKVSRLAAVVGLVVVGLFSFQPAGYYNWGRFTQVSGLSILLIAALVTWEAIRAWRVEWPTHKISVILLSLTAGLLNAGVFLLHFQVAGYMLPLLVVIAIAEFVHACKEKKRILRTLLGILIVVVVSLGLILPALLPAFDVYCGWRSATAMDEVTGLSVSYIFSLDALFGLAAKPWLVILAIGGMVLGLLRAPREATVVVILWTAMLFLEGFSYLFNIPLLAFTNMAGVLIMLYLPIGLLIGILIYALFNQLPKFIAKRIEPIFLWLLMIGALVGFFYRVSNVEDFNYQLMTNEDEAAMKWVAANTPKDAIFAINTDVWGTDLSPYSDAGFLLLYYTQRDTTFNTVLFPLGPQWHIDEVLARAEAANDLDNPDEPSTDRLCALGVDYVYIGAKGTVEGEGFNVDGLQELPGVSLLYDQGGAKVFKICE